MKKAIALIAAGVLALAMVGCAQHSQSMPHHSASQAGHSSKLGRG